MNRVLLSGTVVSDPRKTETKTGTAMLTVRIAVARGGRGTRTVNSDYFNCVMFGAPAERAERLGVKEGSRLFVEGRLRNHDFVVEGRRARDNEVVVYSWEFAERKTVSEDFVREDSETTDAGV